MKKVADKAQSLQKQLNIYKQSVSMLDLEETSYKRFSFLHVFLFGFSEKQV